MKGLDERISNMTPRGFLTRLWIVVSVFSLFTAGLAWWTIQQQYALHHEQAEVATHNLALALERELVGQLQSEEMALFSVQDELYKQRARGRVDAGALNTYIEQVRSRRPEIDAIRITDERGMLVYGTDVKPADKKSLADRSHFIRLRDDANAGLVISKPQLSRINNKLVIVLARRLAGPDGAFGGMVFAAVPMANLTGSFAELDVGRNGVVAMRDDELALVARFPESPLSALGVGSKMAVPELQRQMQAGQTFGTYRAITPADGVERTISFRKVGSYPLLIIVGRASADYLADTDQTAKVIVALVLFFLLVTLLLANMVYRSWARQRRLNQSLLESETRLDELFENMSSGVAVYRASENGQTFSFSGVNRAAEKFDNSRREDLLGKNVVDVFPGIVELGLLEVFKRVWKTGVAERYPLSFYHDGRISGWRDNFVYKLPGGEIVAIYDDVTERMQAQQALEELNRDFVTLLESTSDFIYFKDKDSRIRFCSQSMAVITGHRSWRELVGRHDLEIFPPETAKIYYEEELPIFRDGVPLLNKTDPYLDADGNQGWVNTNKWPVFDADGKTVVGLFGISRDISERVRAEEALRRGESRYRATFDHAAVGIAEVAPDGRFLEINSVFCDIIGYSREEVLSQGFTFQQITLPEDLAADLAQVQRLLDGRDNQYVLEKRYIRKDGGVVWVNLSVALLRDDSGLPLYFISSVADITERKQAEAKLLDSEAFLRTVIENEPECIKIVDAQGRLTQMNPAGLAMIEADSLEQVAGNPVANVIAPEYRVAFARMHKRVIAGEAMQLKFEVQGLRGGRRMLETHAVPMKVHGEVVHLAVTRDITERQKAEDALQRSNADLERFAYSVSHDMRQPLRAVSGHLQLLQHSLKDKLDESDRVNMEFALEGAQRMDSMIVSLLDYSRVGRKTESKQWIASRASVDEALHFLAPLIGEVGADVRLSGDWPQVFASRDEMTRLFQNLIGNAIKFREAGQVPRVEVGSSVQDEQWRVSVRDHGVGIDPQQIDRLFQFFSRLQSRARFEGTGMGLALCRRIVEHHNGRIWVESEGEGKGSVFIFELPLKAMENGAL